MEGESMNPKNNIRLMRALKIISNGMLSLGVLVLLCMPRMTLTAQAFDSSHHIGQHNAIANLAEKANKMNEQKAKGENKYTEPTVVVTTIIDNDDNEKEFIDAHEETNIEKK
jgi:hypothetical protein